MPPLLSQDRAQGPPASASPMSPVVSVLIANFNGGTYVLDALTSAARQSLRDIEIIFIDGMHSNGPRSLRHRA